MFHSATYISGLNIVMSHIIFEPDIVVEGWYLCFIFGSSQDQISACVLVVLTDIILTS